LVEIIHWHYRAANISIRKQYLKSRPVCKVTFRIPEEMGTSAKTAHIVGEFNNWTFFATPMKKLKSGAFTMTLELEPGREYQFRYLLDKRSGEMKQMRINRYPPSMEIVRTRSSLFK
jgi:1,4-alpha-glucan branching enzyme